MFEKRCGYQAYRECRGHDKQANVRVHAPGQSEQPDSSLHFIMLIFFSHVDLVAPPVVIQTALQEGKRIHVGA